MLEEQNGSAVTVTAVKDMTGNPAPLGLLGFGMTTVLLNLANVGVYKLDSVVLAMGVFYGGIAQVIAGVEEWKKNNTFGATAFTSYGFFWISLVALIFFGEWKWIPAPDGNAMAAYLALWGLFTLAMFIGALKLNRALQTVFFTLTVLYLLLIIGTLTGNAFVNTIAGWEGVICGLSAIYTGLAQILNEVYGKTVCPLGAK